MCIWVPEDHPAHDAMVAFMKVQESVMAAALAKWTEQDWADAEYACSLSDEELEVFAREKGWEI